jgi:hypothetical protein
MPFVKALNNLQLVDILTIERENLKITGDTIEF